MEPIKESASLFNDARVGEAVISETHKFKLSFEGLDIGKDRTTL